MIADDETAKQIASLIAEAYVGLSDPVSGIGRLFDNPDMFLAGSGLGELADTPEVCLRMADAVSSFGFRWHHDDVKVWRAGDVAWAFIQGTVRVERDSQVDEVPYWTTGIFSRSGDRWRWQYWHGAEPQAEPKVDCQTL